jgi:tRNA G18 (ribose-2'-O)-methylase SpoU
VLHNIRSAHNTASIFRTSDGAGVEKIYLCGYTPSPIGKLGEYRKDFSKVALGAEKTIPYEKEKSTIAVIKKLKEDGYEIISIEQDKRSIPYQTFKTRKKKIVLVMGNEVSGLPSLVLKLSDHILEIPMAGKKKSLNVSVAFGVAAYRLRYKK